MVRIKLIHGDGNGQENIDVRNIQKIKLTGFSNFLDLAEHLRHLQSKH